MSAPLFGRVATVTVGPLELKGFRVAFRIAKSVRSSSNTAEVVIYGLNESSRAKIQETVPTQLVVEAGYTDTAAVIFRGESVRPQSQKTPTGWITTLVGEDGHTAQREIINETLPPNVPISDIIEALAAKMKVSARRALERAKNGDFNAAIGSIKNGYTLSGTVKTEMDKLTKSLQLQWSIQDEELVILQPGETNQLEAVELSPLTGLIGSPELFLDAQAKKKHLKSIYVRARSLLQPKLHPGRKLLLVTASSVSGSYSVTKTNHNGDTHGTPWYTDLEALEISP